MQNLGYELTQETAKRRAVSTLVGLLPASR
jgi:hypothetical protein